MNISFEANRMRLERFRSAARDAGIKLTPQRLAIFGAVANDATHPNAESVHRAVRESIPNVSLDTVYRTLWMLTDLGLLTAMGSARKGVRFDANPEPHHHYVCNRCGAVQDFQSAELDQLNIPEFVREYGAVGSAQVEVRGICSHCAAN